MNDAVLAFLRQRASVPSRQLTDPGPDLQTLQRLLADSLRVPDHGRLTPWRYVLIERQAGVALGARLQQRLLQREPDAGTAALEKERDRFTRAPVTVALVFSPTPGHKVPEVEQLLSAGCVGMMLLLLAEAQGFGAQWLTGWPAHDAVVAGWLGLAAHERVAGFFYLGTPAAAAPQRPRADIEGRLTRFSAAAADALPARADPDQSPARRTD